MEECLKQEGAFDSPVGAALTAPGSLPPRRSSLHLSCNSIVLLLNQYLQQLLKLKGKNRFAESAAGGFLQTPGGRCGSQSTYRKWGGKVLGGLIDGLSQRGARPLSLCTTLLMRSTDSCSASSPSRHVFLSLWCPAGCGSCSHGSQISRFGLRRFEAQAFSFHSLNPLWYPVITQPVPFEVGEAAVEDNLFPFQSFYVIGPADRRG